MKRIFAKQYASLHLRGGLLCLLLLALTGCSNDDNPASDPVVTPAEAVLGEWYGQVMAGGMISNNRSYDNIAILMTFQDDGHGLVQQYFLNSGQLVYQLGYMTDYIVDDEGIVSIFVAGTNKRLGVDARIVDGKVIVSIPDHFIYDLMSDRPTEAQQQDIIEWGIIIDQWAESGGDDEDDTATEVTTNGAEEPGRARYKY